MERITRKHLEHLAGVINKVTGSPELAYGGEGQRQANIGNYHISGAYGGWTLHRIHNESGGVTTPLSCGYVPARDLYNRMQAFLAGVRS